MALHYRDEEVIYVQASPDRVTVIFSTIFREETDRIFGKVFLQVCCITPTTARCSHSHCHVLGICRRAATAHDPKRAAGALHDASAAT